MKEEKFLHIWTPQHGWGWGELQTLKGNGAIGAQKAKQRIHHRDVASQHFPAKKNLHTHCGKRGAGC